MFGENPNGEPVEETQQPEAPASEEPTTEPAGDEPAEEPASE